MYAASCLQKISAHGIETTRTGVPLASSAAAASMAKPISEPVAMMMAFALAASLRM